MPSKHAARVASPRSKCEGGRSVSACSAAALLSVIVSVLVRLPGASANAPSCSSAVPLGMQSGFIQDSQLSTSHDYASYPTSDGRISDDINTAWTGNGAVGSPHFQVDLLAHTIIEGLIMEGRMDAGETNKRILTFSISYSSDGTNFIDYEESSTVVVFDGNTVEGSTVAITFNNPIVARVIRMDILTYDAKPALRLELYGCYETHSCAEWLGFTTVMQDTTGYFWSSSSYARAYYNVTQGYESVSVCYDDSSDIWDCTSSLGVGNNWIDNSQMTASSSASGYEAWKGRYGPSGVWMPSSNSNSEYLLIDLSVDAYISGFKSRGDRDSSDQADTFYMTYSSDGSSYSSQTEFAEPQEIDTFYLYQTPMSGRYIKFTMASWTNNIAFAVEVYGCGDHLPTAFPATTSASGGAAECSGSEGWQNLDPYGNGTIVYTYCARLTDQVYQTCRESLGVQKKSIIPNSQMSASSVRWNNNFGPSRGRLHSTEAQYGWVAGSDDTSQWLKIDLGQNTVPLITGVATQSRGNGNAQWVETYKVSHSFDDSTWTYVQESGSDKICVGNSEQDTVARVTFDTPFEARYIRFHPQTWNGLIAMRVDVYGCHDSIRTDVSVVEDTGVYYGWYYNSPTDWRLRTYVKGSYTDAMEDLGVSSTSTVANSQITASTESSSRQAYKGRLNYNGCWIPDTVDTNQWIMVDFLFGTLVSQILVQGHNTNANKYVASFYVQHSMGGTNFIDYTHRDEPVLIAGNDGSGTNQVVTESFSPPLFARFIRVNPQTWGSGGPGLRLSFNGLQYNATCEEWMTNKYQIDDTTGVYWHSEQSDYVVCSIDYRYCKSYYNDGFTDDGYYFLDPANGGESESFLAYCNFGFVVNDATIMTTVTHDQTGWILVSNEGGTLEQNITYPEGAPAKVGEMASNADFCYQYLMYECAQSQLYSSSTALSWWRDKDRNKMAYWAGNEAESTGCYCNADSNCIGSSNLCHCDEASANPYRDGGWITNKNLLPISELVLGGVTNAANQGNYTVGDLICFDTDATPPASCLEAYQNGESTDGLFLIQLTSGNFMIVECAFDEVENGIVTRFGHDVIEEFTLNGYSANGEFARDLNYDYGALISLISEYVDGEDACRQSVKYSCENAAPLDPPNAVWYGIRDGTSSSSWAGTSEANKCACGALNSCYDDSLGCNCDAGSSNRLEDNGWITDRTKLPVTQIRAGGTSGSKEAIVKFAYMDCVSEESGSQPPETCYDVKLNGDTAAGAYLIDPDGSGGVDPFLVVCVPAFNSTHAQMLLPHDSEARTHVVGMASAGEYQKMVTYDGLTKEQIDALFTNDPNRRHIACTQSFTYDCKASTLIKDDMGWFVDRHGTARTNWGTADPSLSSCECGVDSSCSRASEVCNCDKDANSWSSDSGDINDFLGEFLPVTQLRFGDTGGGAGSEEAYHTLGQLVCTVGPSKYASTIISFDRLSLPSYLYRIGYRNVSEMSGTQMSTPSRNYSRLLT
ncbi:uncharacterized protein [Diadema antillarum]|uniref:uncharacterized protein n=1 Tax=Diadema antillarum TaxID=105358 RepID=UPI003A88A1AB